jgi:N-acyl-L-homoserine lactone synthetase
MQSSQQIRLRERPSDQRLFLTGLLQGYRFAVARTEAEVASAIDVRKRVYVEECGYDVPTPDEYDKRSWLLVAEDVRTNAVIGSMRVTPRATGPLEAEEYFVLPPHLRSAKAVEITRFAILPGYRKSRRFVPVVAMGLFKLVSNFVRQVGAQYVVVCAKPERVWTYEWLRFQRLGMTCEYEKLAGIRHELMAADLKNGWMGRDRDHRYWDFFFEADLSEVVLPDRIPDVGVGARPALQPAMRRMS